LLLAVFCCLLIIIIFYPRQSLFSAHTHTTHNNMNKTKVMISGESYKGVHNTGRWPCGVCGRGVGRNSI